MSKDKDPLDALYRALVFADWCDENGYPLNAAALRERYPQ